MLLAGDVRFQDLEHSYSPNKNRKRTLHNREVGTVCLIVFAVITHASGQHAHELVRVCVPAARALRLQPVQRGALAEVGAQQASRQPVTTQKRGKDHVLLKERAGY